MEKIDRLGWAAGMALTAYGVSIGIRVKHPETLKSVITHLPPEWERAQSQSVKYLYSIISDPGKIERPGLRRFHLLYVNSLRLARTAAPEQLFATLESDLQLRTAEHAQRRVFVHAGVVGWNGRAIVIPGRSFSGKSTLVAALVKAGATYYSDEYAVFDSRGRVWPFARPLALRQEGEERPLRVTAAELGGKTGSVPLPLGLVVLCQYRKGAKWRPKAKSPGQGLLGLLANTVPARKKPRLVMATLRRALSDARTIKGNRGEASEMVSLLLTQLDRERYDGGNGKGTPNLRLSVMKR